MTIICISAAVAAISLVVLTIVVINASGEVKKTAVAARNFIDKVDTEIKPILVDLHEALNNLKLVSEGAADKIDDVKSFMAAAGDTGRNLHAINNAVGSVTGLVTKSSLWMTGLKVAGKFLVKRLITKRG